MSQPRSPRRPRSSGRARSVLRGLRFAFCARDEQLLAALAHGLERRGLREYFGTARHADLEALAARAERAWRRPTASRPRVLIIPGMMGSRLGRRDRPARTVWIDPERIGAGELARLALPRGRTLEAQGVLLQSYARLLLTLRIEGFDPEFFPYDWRLGLAGLGRRLARALATPGAPRLIIAHSMGGLVARAALAHLPPRQLERLIFLGTPHGGCFDPVLALRGTHPFVQSLAQLDAHHGAAALARVFRTFPGLHDLLPSGSPTHGSRRGLDLLQARSWPRSGTGPDPKLLARARRTRARLAAASARMVQITGYGVDTIERAAPGPGGFAYAMSSAGDGTVPLARTRLKGLRTLYVAALHGQLANHPEVIRAILELLRTGSTRRLKRRPPRRPAARACTDDARLTPGEKGKIDWRRLSQAGRACILEQLDGYPRKPQRRAGRPTRNRPAPRAPARRRGAPNPTRGRTPHGAPRRRS